MNTQKMPYRNALRSQKLIKDAFLQLMRTTDINKIKVKDVIELADISKGTFYAHYNSMHDVLDEIENQYLELLFRILEEKKLSVVSEKMFLLFLSGLNHMENDQEIFTILFSHNYGNSFINKVKSTFIKYMVNLFNKASLPNNEEAIAAYFAYVAGGAISIIQKWLNDSCVVEVERVAGFLSECALSGVKAIDVYINR